MATLCRLFVLYTCMSMYMVQSVSESAYGIILPSCVLSLVRHFKLNKEDSVVDLGSGIGNICRDVSPFVS